MAGHVMAPYSCIHPHVHEIQLRKRGYASRLSRIKVAQRKPRGRCSVRWLPSLKSHKLNAPTVLNFEADLFPGESSCKCTCSAPLADLDAMTASDWVRTGDQFLLMASIFLTYMAGVIPFQKSGYSPKKNISEKNPDVEASASSGREKDFEGGLKSTWDIVRVKLLDSFDSIKHESALGSRVLRAKQSQGKPPLSLYAISEGPRLYLLWTCFQQLEKEAKNISHSINMDGWMIVFRDIVRKVCQPACTAWLERELLQENDDSEKVIIPLLIRKLNEEDTVLEKIRKSGKEALYAEFLYFHIFGSLRKVSCYDPGLFRIHGVSILEDFVITLADGISATYLELISVDGNLSNEMSCWGSDICNLSSRALQKLRNEVALYQWLHQNLEAVVSMYEDCFDLYVLQSHVIGNPDGNGTESHSWWRKLKLGKPETASSPLRYSVISDFSMPVKRTKELKALSGWRYYFSLFLELSDIGMPIIRVMLGKISSIISFFLVTLIGRSLGLIYTGIRQSLRWK